MWLNLECILPSPKAIYYMILFIWHSAKAKLQGQEIDQWLSEIGSERKGLNYYGHGRAFGGVRTVLYSDCSGTYITVCIFVKSYKTVQ